MHAECVFVSGPSQAIIKGYVDDIRAAAVHNHRDPADILVFLMFTAVTASTQGAAENKYTEYRDYVRTDGALALMSGWAGVDLGAYQADDVAQYVQKDAGRSTLASFAKADPARAIATAHLPEH